METEHPDWCVGTESPGADHVSETVHAAEPTDGTDIRLRLEELAFSDHRTMLLWLEIMEDNETYTCPLLLPQARLLKEKLEQLLP